MSKQSDWFSQFSHPDVDLFFTILFFFVVLVFGIIAAFISLAIGLPILLVVGCAYVIHWANNRPKLTVPLPQETTTQVPTTTIQFPNLVDFATIFERSFAETMQRNTKQVPVSELSKAIRLAATALYEAETFYEPSHLLTLTTE